MPDTKPGFRSCPVDRARAALAGGGRRVVPSRFRDLHPDGRALVTRWIGRAADERDGEPFEAFIYGWIGLNGWAACVCAEEQDTAQLQMMQLDPGLTQNFLDLMSGDEFRNAALGFSSMWPIFRVSRLPEAVRSSRPKKGGRRAVTSYYQSECPDAQRAPDCHLIHTGDIHPDWSHTLEALYRVRCNLFHGQKSGAGNEDRAILTAAAAVLVPIASSVLRLY